MKRHLNTLYVTTEGTYLRRQGRAVLVRVENETRLRVPIHSLGGVVCFGRVSCSPSLLGLCTECGVGVSFLSTHGRFLARVVGPTSGNVLLRREQYRQADDPQACSALAVPIVAAKVANTRTVLQRFLRDHPGAAGAADVEDAVRQLARNLADLARGVSTDAARGIEGEAARTYFGVFGRLVTSQEPDFTFARRSRRPPTDPINALLSFLYTLLVHDATSALETVGLDPAVGFLHRDRPGRPSLALDLVEEFRAFLSDRLALTLVNQSQVRPAGFTVSESGAVWMDDGTRKTVLTAYQKRKQHEIEHPFLREKTTIGLLLHLQARLLARALRGDLDAYPPFIWK